MSVIMGCEEGRKRDTDQCGAGFAAADWRSQVDAVLGGCLMSFTCEVPLEGRCCRVVRQKLGSLSLVVWKRVSMVPCSQCFCD
jgi:hypothetical protein